MAPVTVTSAGIARQIIDDVELIDLIERLSKFDPTDASPAGVAAGDNNGGSNGEKVAIAAISPSASGPPLDIDGLVAELEKYPKWRFQEQVSITVLQYCNCCVLLQLHDVSLYVAQHSEHRPSTSSLSIPINQNTQYNRPIYSSGSNH